MIEAMVTVVTGASGFLGGYVVRRLVAEGRRVRCVDQEKPSFLGDLDVDWARADVRDLASLATAFEGARAVFHLAAVISVAGDLSGRVWATNVQGVRHAAEAALAAGVERFVHCSSVHAYDLEAVARVDENSPRADNSGLPVYDRSKAAGEAELREVIANGLDAVIVNPTGVFGPGDARSRINGIFLAMFQRRLPALIDGGFDWVDVRDVAQSLVAAERMGRTGENYLLPGHQLSLLELGLIAERVSGVAKPAFILPMWFARVWSPLADWMGRHTENPLSYTSDSLHALRFHPSVCGDKARAELGHDPRPTSETIEDIYRWAIDEGLIDPRRA